MSNEERLMELLNSSGDKEKALDTAIELWRLLSKQLQAEKGNAPETPAKQNETTVA